MWRSRVIRAVEPGLPEDGARFHTTVASDERLTLARQPRRQLEDVGPHAVVAFASWIAAQTFAEVSGMSMFVMPIGCRASITAFT